ncbi:MAG: hypothetical protein IPK07_34065 [Deltaproteobacteria bacterium]|nr:hypothetical protein [Deltaproteobacteria bacterium]
MKTLTEFSPILLRRGAEVRSAKSAEGLEGDALAEAVASELAIPAERTARLLEALEVVGDLGAIRLVRVFQGESGPPGSIARGEFHYVLDRVSSGPRRDRDTRGGRGGGRGDRPGRGGGPGRGGDRGGPPGGGRGDRPFGERADRGPRGDIPRAGEGWQLTSAPREPRAPGGDHDRSGRPPRGGRPGPGGPPRGPRLGPDGKPLPPRGPRLGPDGKPLPPRGPRPGADGKPLPPRPPRGPRLGPDGKPLPPRWPDANGNGPDGKPWRGGRRGPPPQAGAGAPPPPVQPESSAAPVAEPPPPAPKSDTPEQS